MKKHLVLLLLFTFSFAIYAQKKPKIKGNKEVVDITKTIEDAFNAIEVSDDLEVSINQTFHNGYALKADANLVDVVKFVVEDSILRIYTSHRIASSKKLEINLSLKTVDQITLKGSSKIKGVGKLSSEAFNILGYDSSRFDLDLSTTNLQITLHRNAGGKIKIKSDKAQITMNDRTDLKAYLVTEEVTVSLNKSAQLDLDGEADKADFNLKENAELSAKKMKVSSANLVTSNSSDVYIYASKNLELYAEGKSIIYVYGNPEMEVKGLTDKSKIIKR